jgi:hypothetical protein
MPPNTLGGKMKLIILFILTMLALIAKDDLKGYRRNQTIDSHTVIR